VGALPVEPEPLRRAAEGEGPGSTANALVAKPTMTVLMICNVPTSTTSNVLSLLPTYSSDPSGDTWTENGDAPPVENDATCAAVVTSRTLTVLSP
jgi:hypothetical protein